MYARIYSAWIKLDDVLPWIEFEDAFKTKAEAQKAVQELQSEAQIRISKLQTRIRERKNTNSTSLKQEIARFS